MGGSGRFFLFQLLRRFRASGSSNAADEQLLANFAESHDEEAFASIVHRHGPLVLHVCRQVLRDPQDIEDAFQATFLVLARRAGSLRKPERLAGWLYGVAHRVATRIRIRIARLRSREKLTQRLEDQVSSSQPPEADAWYLVHEEVNRLPEKFRLPIVLCYFQGMTRQEAACQLGWTEGKIKGSLERGRDLLRSRLLRHGSLLAGLLPAVAQTATLPSVPGPVFASTVAAAGQLAKATTTAAAGISHSVLSLTEEVLQTMFSTRLILTVASLVLVGLMVPGAWLYSQHHHPNDAPGKSSPRPTVVVANTSAPAPVVDPIARELRELAGVWKFEANETEDPEWAGKDAPLETIQKGRLEIHGENMTWSYPAWTNKISFKIDPSKTPKQIDITFLDGKRKGKTYQGIYQVQKRKDPLPWLLELCLRDNAHAELGRPTKSLFSSGDQGLSLIILSRYPKDRLK